MTFELKKIDLFSAIKVSFIVHIIIGLLLGLFIGSVMAFVMSFVGQFIPYDQMGNDGPSFGAIGALGGFFMAFVYAIFISVVNGVIVTGIVVLLYNLIAGWVGGVKLNLQEIPGINVKPSATIAQSTETGGESANV